MEQVARTQVVDWTWGHRVTVGPAEIVTKILKGAFPFP